VPEKWTETLYGRVKRKHFHTRWHCDAFNTVFQRALLDPSNLLEAPLQVEGEKFYSKQRLEGNWFDIPIFTFWICLRDVKSSATSHLRIYPGSHKLPGMHLANDLHNVIPEGFRYSSKLFLGPEFPEGYEIGDLIVFHCLTQHEANPHRAADESDEERLSMDGRFFLQL